MSNRDKIIAAAREAGCNAGYLGSFYSSTEALERFYAIAFESGAASRDAEVAELAAALEDNWNCNPCETTRQQKAFDVAQSVLAKVRKP